LRKAILGDGKFIMSLKTSARQLISGFGVKKSSSLRLSLPLLFYTDASFGVVIYLENCGGRSS